SCAVSFIVFYSATLKYKKENPEKSFKQLNSGFLCYIFVNYSAGYQAINKSARSPNYPIIKPLYYQGFRNST
ncbi:hypothetical protein, partial [Cyclobacterium sediminis]